MIAGLTGTRTPAFTLPRRHFILGLVSYLLSMLGLMVYGPELTQASWSPHLLALTHLFALGTVGAVIMGASYQLLPVVLMAELWSERLARLTFWPYLAGVATLVVGFWTWRPAALATGAALVLLALGLFLMNLAVSIVRGHQRSVVATAMQLALGSLGLGAGLGGLRALELAGYLPGLGLPLRAAHAHLVAFGGASLLIFGVSYRLIAMFAVSKEDTRGGPWVVALGALGLVVSVVGHLGSLPGVVPAGASLMALATLGWIATMVRLLRARARAQLDVGLSMAASAMAHLGVTTGIGLLLAFQAWPVPLAPAHAEAAYGLLGLVGWIGFTIIGQIYKIVPFLAWYHRFGARVGQRGVPLIKDMYDVRLAWAGFAANQTGLLVAVLGVAAGLGLAVQVGGGLLALGAMAALGMLGQVLTARGRERS